MTVITCPSVYVCGDAVFGDASEGSKKSYLSPSWYRGAPRLNNAPCMMPHEPGALGMVDEGMWF